MPGQQLTSSNGEYEFIMQGDGNAVLYINASKKAIWNSGTAGQPGDQLRMQVCVAHHAICHGEFARMYVRRRVTETSSFMVRTAKA